MLHMRDLSHLSKANRLVFLAREAITCQDKESYIQQATSTFIDISKTTSLPTNHRK